MNKLKAEIQKLKDEKPKNDAFRAIKSPETVKQVFSLSIEPAIQEIMDALSELDDLFIRKDLWIGHANGGVSVTSFSDIKRNFELNRLEYSSSILFTYHLRGYKNPRIKPYNVECIVRWDLEEYHYSLDRIGTIDCKKFPQQYDIFYSQEEIAEIAELCVHFD